MPSDEVLGGKNQLATNILIHNLLHIRNLRAKHKLSCIISNRDMLSQLLIGLICQNVITIQFTLQWMT